MAWNFNPMRHKSALGNPTMAGAAGLINAEMSGVDRIAGGLDSYNQGNAIAKKRAELENKGFVLDENGRVVQKPSVAGTSGGGGGRGKSGSGSSGLSQGKTIEQQSLAESFAENKMRVAELTNYVASGNGTDIDKTDAALLLDKLKVEQAGMLSKLSKDYSTRKALSNIGGVAKLKSGKKNSDISVGNSVGERKMMRALTRKQRDFVRGGGRLIEGVPYFDDGSKATDKNIDRHKAQRKAKIKWARGAKYALEQKSNKY